MTTGNKERPSGSIPIRFMDDEDQDMTESPQGSVDFDLSEVEDDSLPSVEIHSGEDRNEAPIGGPELAELIAARSELKRLQSELAESREAVARHGPDVTFILAEAVFEEHGLVIADDLLLYSP